MGRRVGERRPARERTGRRRQAERVENGEDGEVEREAEGDGGAGREKKTTHIAGPETAAGGRLAAPTASRSLDWFLAGHRIDPIGRPVGTRVRPVSGRGGGRVDLAGLPDPAAVEGDRRCLSGRRPFSASPSAREGRGENRSASAGKRLGEAGGSWNRPSRRAGEPRREGRADVA